MSQRGDLGWLPQPTNIDFSAACKELLADPKELGNRIRFLAGHNLDQNQLEKLARAIRGARKQNLNLAPLSVTQLGLLSNSTSDFAVPALTATAPRFGLSLEVVSAGFDQVVQEAINPQSALHRAAPDFVLIALDWRGVPLKSTPGEADDAIVDAVLGHFATIRGGIKANSKKAVCIWQNLAAMPERLFGSFDRVLPGVRRRVIDKVNLALADMVHSSGDVLLDVAGVAELVGLENWHSPKQWNLAKLPFAQEYLPLYADHVCRTVAALRGKSRRVLVLDLDHTLWGGVIGDDGVQGIAIAQGDATGEAYQEFQRYVLSLRERGVVLAVSSKNEDKTARAPFREHPEMVLKEEHFAVFQANWNDKPTNIRAIAEELSLGLDSFVFADDNPFERELVRKTLPQVAVPEMPVDPALYTRVLSAAGYFEATAFSDEDAKRADFYAGNARRASLQKQVTDLDGYLKSLEMEIWFQPFDGTNRARITQLINKSNQFNLTTRRYSEPDVESLEHDESVFTLQVRLKDTFGDNGMISVVICKPAPNSEWEIDTWLMSCRVLGRRVEQMVLREVLAHAKRHGIRRLLGRYIPTDRNVIVKDHYLNLGFLQTAESENGGSQWCLSVADAIVEPAPMIVHSIGFREPALSEPSSRSNL